MPACRLMQDGSILITPTSPDEAQKFRAIEEKWREQDRFIQDGLMDVNIRIELAWKKGYIPAKLLKRS